MTPDEALARLETALIPMQLSKLEAAIFCQAWDEQSYLKIARNLGYDEGYIRGVAAELWRKISDSLEISVTKRNIKRALNSYFQDQLNRNSSSSSDHASTTIYVDWGDVVDTSRFYGRCDELNILTQWIVQDHCRLVAIAGIGGIGKTMLAAQAAQQIAETQQFDIVIWRSLRQAPPLTNLVLDVLNAIAPQQNPVLELDVAMRQLLEQLRAQRCLLILDNAEAILSASKLVGQYRVGYEDYGWLFQQLGAGQHQSSILMTSREIPVEVASQEGPAAPVRLLNLTGLSVEAGEAILAAKGLTVTEPAQAYELIQHYQGNPLALKLVASPIRDLFDGNIAAFLAQETLLFHSIRDLLEQQFERLSSVEQQVMYWLAINREAVTEAQLRIDLLPSVSQAALRDALLSLDQRSLIEKLRPTVLSSQTSSSTLMRLNSMSYTQQPVVMEYVTERLIEQVCQEVEQAEIICLRSHALLKAQAKDYVRDIQLRLIVQPILTRLLETQGGRDNLKNLLLQLLNIQQLQAPLQPGYFAGNAINLLRQLGVDLSGLDFSNLMIWQADLRMLNLHGTNLSHSDLSQSAFTQAMAEIMCVAFSPDANHIATGDYNGEVCVWQLQDGQQLVQFRRVGFWIRSIVFSSDGETLAVSNQEGIIKLLHIPSQTVRRELSGHKGAVWCLAISADGRLLASGGEDRTVKIWDMQTGECQKTLEGHQGWLWSLDFSPAAATPNQPDRLVSGGGDRTARLWDVQTGQTLQVFTDHTDGILAVAFSPDGQTLASAGVDDTIRLWDAETGSAIATWRGHDRAAAWTLAFSPDGRTLASGSEDQTIKLWDVDTQHCRRTLHGHTGVVQSIAFNPDGHTLVSAAYNQSIRLWDVATGQCIKTFHGYSKVVFCAVFSPSGQLLASGHGDNVLRLWDMQTGDCLKALQGHTGRVSSVAFSPNGQLLASGSYDQTIRLWDVQTGHFLRVLRTHSWIKAVAFSPDGSLLASSGVDRVVRLWEVATGQCLREIAPGVNWIPSIAFSPVEKQLASGNADGTVKLWHTNSSECLLTLKGHTRQVQTLAFDPTHHQLASGSDDHTIKLWDLQTGQCLQTLVGHTRAVVSISFHPRRSLLASGSFDQTLKLWDLQQGIAISTLQGHTSPVSCLTFDPEGYLLASSSEDGTIRLWNSATGECLRVLTADRPYEDMNILGVTGITDAQKETLRVLGAIEY